MQLNGNRSIARNTKFFAFSLFTSIDRYTNSRTPEQSTSVNVKQLKHKTISIICMNELMCNGQILLICIVQLQKKKQTARNIRYNS